MIIRKILFIILVLFFCFPFSFKVEASSKIKVLLVPGHDNEVWGTQYGNVKEAAMNLAVATRIYNILKKDERFNVYITRDKDGYTKEFSSYFKEHESDIISFKEDAQKETKNKISIWTFIEKISPPHVTVKKSVSVILYGINKWANENSMDAVVHIHFNDYPRKTKWKIGKYSGFAIYMPDGQMENGFESGQLAANIYTQLNKKYKVSDYGQEVGGLIPDQKLIALGVSGTLDANARSVLVEYGYVYEKIFRKYKTRHNAYDDMATRTAKGIKNYFFVK